MCEWFCVLGLGVSEQRQLLLHIFVLLLFGCDGAIEAEETEREEEREHNKKAAHSKEDHGNYP